MTEREGGPTILCIRILTEDGKALRAAKIGFTEAPVEMPDIAALTNDAGEAVLAAPQPGLYRLECHRDGFEMQSVEFMVSDEKQISRLVRLKAMRSES